MKILLVKDRLCIYIIVRWEKLRKLFRFVLGSFPFMLDFSTPILNYFVGWNGFTIKKNRLHPKMVKKSDKQSDGMWNDFWIDVGWPGEPPGTDVDSILALPESSRRKLVDCIGRDCSARELSKEVRHAIGKHRRRYIFDTTSSLIYYMNILY